MTPSATPGIRCSRSGISHPLGKFTAKFPPFKGPELVKDLLEQEAAKQGMSLAEFIRELCIVRAVGVDKLSSLHSQRLAVVAGMGHEVDKNR